MGAKVDVNADLALWFGILVGPIAWAMDLTIGYALADTRCNQPHTILWLHVLTLCTLGAIAMGAGAAAFAPRHNERAESMARLGLLMCALFAVLVVATEIPRFLLHVCY